MKKEKATVYSRRIRYEWYDRKAQREKGMFAELGYREEDFASRSSWLNKRAKVHKVVKQILDAFRQAGYIADIQKPGREIPLRGWRSCWGRPPKSDDWTTEK